MSVGQCPQCAFCPSSGQCREPEHNGSPVYDGSQYLTGYIGAALAVAGPALGAGIGIAGSAFGETKYMLVSAGFSVPIILFGIFVAVIIYPHPANPEDYCPQKGFAALSAGTGIGFAGLAAGLLIAATGALPPDNLGLPCPPLVTRILVCVRG